MKLYECLQQKEGDSSTGSADTGNPSTFPDKLQAIVVANGYKPQQVFNVDETGLFWKCMLSRTYITK